MNKEEVQRIALERNVPVNQPIQVESISSVQAPVTSTTAQASSTSAPAKPVTTKADFVSAEQYRDKLVKALTDLTSGRRLTAKQSAYLSRLPRLITTANKRVYAINKSLKS